jgi:hypothetical protein
VPVLALADRVGLPGLVGEQLTVPTDRGAHAGSKLAALVAAMVAGAESIEDMGLLRHGGMGRLFGDTYAPSTLGSFLRAFAFGHIRQLDAVAARLVANLAAHTPLLPDAGQIAYLDVDDTVRQTYGYAKQGTGYGYTGVKGLNVLLATLSTPSAAPVIVASRLRKGSANSARGAARIVADALKTSRVCGATGLLVVRARIRPSTAPTSSPPSAERAPASRSPPDRTAWCDAPSLRSMNRRGRRSAIRGRSSTSNWASGSATPNADKAKPDPLISSEPQPGFGNRLIHMDLNEPGNLGTVAPPAGRGGARQDCRPIRT